MPAAEPSSRSPRLLQIRSFSWRKTAVAGTLAAAAALGLVVLSSERPSAARPAAELFDTSAQDNIGRSPFWDTSSADNEGATRALRRGVTYDRMSGLLEQMDGDVEPLLGAHFPSATLLGARHPAYADRGRSRLTAGHYSAESAQQLSTRVAADTKAMQSDGWESGFPDPRMQDRSALGSRPPVDDFESQRMASAGFESGFPDRAGRVYDRASRQVAHRSLSATARMQSLLQAPAEGTGGYDDARRAAQVLGCGSVRFGRGAVAQPCASEEHEIAMLKNKLPAYVYKGAADRGTLASAAATDFSAEQFRRAITRTTPNGDADAADDAFLAKARADPPRPGK